MPYPPNEESCFVSSQKIAYHVSQWLWQQHCADQQQTASQHACDGCQYDNQQQQSCDVQQLLQLTMQHQRCNVHAAEAT